jgi:LysM repeat protein
MEGIVLTYTVQPGDTLWLNAQRFGLTLPYLLSLNPQITNPSLIFPGQVIVISGPPEPPTRICPLLSQGSRGNDVVRLQTLLQIVGFNPGPIDGIFGIQTRNALMAFQRSVKEGLPVTGETDIGTWIMLGAECNPGPIIPPGAVRYIIRPGESLYIVATRFNITVQEILQANPQITNPNLVYAGQEILIPVR